MKFYIRTFGCQMNINESEIMAGLLKEEGFEWTENPKEADIILINSCAVREKAENKMYGAIGGYGKLKDENKNLILGVGGCSAEKERENLLERFKNIDFVFGTRNVVDIGNLVKRALNGKRFADFSDKLNDVNYDIPKMPISKHHAWITIIYGCNKYCSYCIVPYTRGFEKSRPMEDIIREVESYAKKGYKEITFLGQNVDSYGKDFGDKKSKLDLLIQKAAEFDSIKRIWFLTSYPSDITDSLIQTVANEEKAANYFHLPAQSGSNKILKAMNRKYTREEFIELVNKVKKEVANVTVSSDFITGFPSETDEDFEETVDLIKQCRFERINIAEYSPREGTIAYKYQNDDVPKHIKNKRLQYLMELQKRINLEENEKYLEQEVVIIQEGKAGKNGTYMGRTMNNKLIIFESNEELNGEFLKVKVNKITPGPLYGEVVNNLY
ncbi:RNA modification enzyme, MiaB family [Petrotoga mobilis SJ95]|uniref:tRNA-2-methylthio-N(6)-dimethylallyladenosine synthase n=1 Tax=Petrotoga mobilis (strain DSM 10674 / SJ95) TaxID=403833 RepID=MIAB_PETMO|nr:RecName: Full=tRNA-2-methylthio-N(6)-dimethylallyladenosine synthase; AltName: Full=(Dimethylallyl)adenosine tRNA methylthiotransferase MiaB; AltName: Full=tRNA-i(6)A37 methylthiotransferase [Petrotoga mobilis SJ95]ABX32538.1 RNA modification enzyme, MiaB family [Petrotoga mobilis SJ95]